MAKSIGILLIMSSIAALIAGAFIDLNYGAAAEITGRAITNHFESMRLFDYVEATILSYSIISLIMGLVFLFRV